MHELPRTPRQSNHARKETVAATELALLTLHPPKATRPTYRERAISTSHSRDRRLIETSAACVAARDAERYRLARDLHDDLGAELTALRFALARIAASLPDAVPPACQSALDSAEAALDAAFDASRRVVSERRHADASQTLGAQLRDWISSFAERTEMPIGFDYKADPRLDPVDDDTTMAIVRITQEALNNMVRHARANEASVRLTVLVSGVQLTVTDNGRGLGEGRSNAREVRRAAGAPLQSVTLSGGMGLSSMRERCEALGGRLEFLTPTGGGLSLKASLPWRGRMPAERRGSGSGAAAGKTERPVPD